ncbi:MAG: YfhO family protein [Lactobacillales bacterium]|jgi:uncharacterized membrane protein YfhO|nr:YfhO family protein [Lactobacillales bacterium]
MKRYYGFAFLLSILILGGALASIGVYWGGPYTVLASDSFAQFSNFHAAFNNFLHGKQGALFTTHASLGINFLSLYSYYLGGFFTFLVVFFKNFDIPNALYLITLLKFGAMGLSAYFYIDKTFKLNRNIKLGLALCYPFCGFIIAHLELIMWLDCFIYLPLIIYAIDKSRFKLLFGLFILAIFSNFYFAYMIMIFATLYYLLKCKINWRYFFVLIGSALASSVFLLPVVLDIKNNGEKFSGFKRLLHEDAGPLDIIIKNTVGGFDTTKYHSLTFFYAGLFVFILLVYYFVNKKINLHEKITSGILIGGLIISFYFEPLNLLWQGMHEPIMFLSRFTFLWSFLVIMLAARALEDPDYLMLAKISGILFLIFGLVYLFVHKKYLNIGNESVTLIFLALFGVLCFFFYKKEINEKIFPLLILLVIVSELSVNALGAVNGIKQEWVFSGIGAYTNERASIGRLVDKTKNDELYHLENLDPISANDCFNFGYSGISMFSSIRNRHSSDLLNKFGYKSKGTNLNIRYKNNTILADALFNIKYNIDNKPINKSGFKLTKHKAPVALDGTPDKWKLYENENALGAANLVDESVLKTKIIANDNIMNQQNLLNAMAQTNYNYFSFEKLQNQKVTSVAKNTEKNNVMNLKAFNKTTPMTLSYDYTTTPNVQNYLSLFFTNGDIADTDVTIEVYRPDGTPESETNPIIKGTYEADVDGQYFDLGTTSQPETYKIIINFNGAKKLSVINPQILKLNTESLAYAAKRVEKLSVKIKNGFEIKTNNKNNKLLFTTIPDDGNFTAKIDGKKVKITPYQNALLAVKVPAGKHTIRFTYLPKGLEIGAIISSATLGIFILMRKKL